MGRYQKEASLFIPSEAKGAMRRFGKQSEDLKESQLVHCLIVHLTNARRRYNRSGKERNADHYDGHDLI
jgi:hypothetical protein